MHVVIGAGPAGLAVASRLERAGHDVAVLEASERVGGMAASIDVAGIRVDLGSHRLHPSTPNWLLDELRSMVDLQVRERNGRIRLQDRWLPFPLTPRGLATGLQPGFAARAALEAATSATRSPSTDSYAEVLRAGVGPTLYSAFYEPYAWKLFGCDPEVLSGELARRRVSASTPSALVSRVLGGARTRPTFLYPRTGFGAITEALANRVGKIETGRRVTRLIEHEDRVIVGLSDGRLVTAEHVFATVPAPVVARWLSMGDARSSAPPVRAVVLVYLVLDHGQFSTWDAHYLPERNVLAARISEPTNYRNGDDPTDRTVLSAEIPCWPGDATWQATDDALAGRVVDDLARCGLPAAAPCGVHVERLPSVYPVMTPDALDSLEIAEAALGTARRVTVLGRQGLFTQDNTHHVLEMGFRAARCVDDNGQFDHLAWNEARRGFRSFVVQD